MGVLAKSMDEVEANGKSFVKVDQALHNMAKHSEVALKELTEGETPKDTLVEIKDVSQSLLASTIEQGPFLGVSAIQIYKGILANLVGWSTTCIDRNLCGVMAGSHQSVHDVVLCKNIADALSYQPLVDRWAARKISVMGLVLWLDCDTCNQGDIFIPTLMSLNSEYMKMPLVIIRDSVDVEMWEIELSSSSNCPARCVRCCTNPSTNRKKDETYTVADMETIGVDSVGSARNKMNYLLKNFISQRFQSKLTSLNEQSSDEKWHKQVHVPADGLCFFHSIIASLDESWHRIPRDKTTGWAQNKRVLQKEEEIAKSLRSSAIAHASQTGIICNESLDEIMKGHVSLSDVQWIALALNLAVRCTIPSEAWWFKTLLIYIYIYVVRFWLEGICLCILQF